MSPSRPAVRRWTIVVAVGLVLAGAVLGVRWAGRETSSAPATGGSSSDLVQQFPPGTREQVDEFDAGLLEGGSATEEILRGGVSVVNVWGSWCGPCRVEAPVLAKLAEEYTDRVTFLGINVRDNPGSALAFEESFGIPYSSVHPDDSAELLLAFGSALRTAAVPVTLVLDAEGGVAARVLGAVDEGTLRALVDEALYEAAGESVGGGS